MIILYISFTFVWLGFPKQDLFLAVILAVLNPSALETCHGL